MCGCFEKSCECFGNMCTCFAEFYVFLTVYLGIILVNNQLDAQYFFVYVYFNSIQTCTPDGHLHRVTYTRCRIDTIDSPDDEHMGARNM